MSSKIKQQLAEVAADLGIGKISRHIFLCADATKPKCASSEDGLESWDYLKGRLKELISIKARTASTAPKPTA